MIVSVHLKTGQLNSELSFTCPHHLDCCKNITMGWLHLTQEQSVAEILFSDVIEHCNWPWGWSVVIKVLIEIFRSAMNITITLVICTVALSC